MADPKEQGEALATERRFCLKQNHGTAEKEREKHQQSTEGPEHNGPPLITNHQTPTLGPTNAVYRCEPLNLLTPSPSSSNITTDHIFSPDRFPEVLVDYDGDVDDFDHSLPKRPRADNVTRTNKNVSRAERGHSFTDAFSNHSGGVGSDSDSDEWQSPLHLAASQGHDRRVRFLLQKHYVKAIIDEPDSNGQTALMRAIQSGFANVVLTLLNAGAAVDSPRDKQGQTALHLAVMARQSTVLRYLLEKGNNAGRDGTGNQKGVNVDALDGTGLTPLHRAIDSGFEAGVEILLDFGANLTEMIELP